MTGIARASGWRAATNGVMQGLGSTQPWSIVLAQAEMLGGLKRLRAYWKEGDEDRGVWKDRPRHDEASHGADAFLTHALSAQPLQPQYRLRL